MRKRPMFGKLAARHAGSRLKRQFLDVRVLHHERLVRPLEQGPAILAANHVCWWDPLVLLWLAHVSSLDGYCLMEREALRSLPFFGTLGALPISIDAPARNLAELRHAVRVLDRPRRVLGVFPGGVQQPAHLPCDFKLGVAHLSRAAKVPVIPLALRYDFHEGPRAIVHLCFGSPVAHSSHDHRAFVDVLAHGVSEGMGEIDEHLRRNLAAPSLLHKQPVALDRERLPAGTRLLSSIFTRRTNEPPA